jgi:hypothetical protein
MYRFFKTSLGKALLLGCALSTLPAPGCFGMFGSRRARKSTTPPTTIPQTAARSRIATQPTQPKTRTAALPKPRNISTAEHKTLTELENLKKKKAGLAQQGKALSAADVAKRQTLKASLPGYTKGTPDGDASTHRPQLNTWQTAYKNIGQPTQPARTSARARFTEATSRFWKPTDRKSPQEQANLPDNNPTAPNNPTQPAAAAPATGSPESMSKFALKAAIGAVVTGALGTVGGLGGQGIKQLDSGGGTSSHQQAYPSNPVDGQQAVDQYGNPIMYDQYGNQIVPNNNNNQPVPMNQGGQTILMNQSEQADYQQQYADGGTGAATGYGYADQGAYQEPLQYDNNDW